MTVFENMTPEENDFLERMKSAPPEQIASFRLALNQLMSCYAGGTGAILATHLNRETGEMQTSGINLQPEEMLFVAGAALQVIQQNAAPREDETVQ